MAEHPTAKAQTVKSQSNETAETFGQRVEIARKRALLTKEELERRAGLASGYVSRITRDVQGGKRPSAATAEALAGALGVEASSLLYGDPEPTEKAGLHLVRTRANLDHAAALLRREGLLESSIEAHVRESTIRLGELDIATWIHVLTDIQRRA